MFESCFLKLVYRSPLRTVGLIEFFLSAILAHIGNEILPLVVCMLTKAFDLLTNDFFMEHASIFPTLGDLYLLTVFTKSTFLQMSLVLRLQGKYLIILASLLIIIVCLGFCSRLSRGYRVKSRFTIFYLECILSVSAL